MSWHLFTFTILTFYDFQLIFKVLLSFLEYQQEISCLVFLYNRSSIARNMVKEVVTVGL